MRTQLHDPPAMPRSPQGQALVETVVMLPILVVLILGIAYLKALTEAQVRAVEATRYATWESVWSVRGDGTMKTSDQLKADLKKMGLGKGLKSVTIGRQPLGNFITRVEQPSGATDRQPSFFIPQVLSDLFGGSVDSGDSGGFLSGLVSGADSGVNTVFNIGGAVAVPIHDFFAYQTNWKDEADKGLFNVTTVYRFGGAGIFSYLGTHNVVGHASILTHPWNIQRTTNNEEYEALVGDTDTVVFNPVPPDPDAGHLYYLWLAPSGGAPPNTPLGPALSGVADVLGTVLNVVKNFISGPGALLDMLSFGSTRPGWHTPSGTLKEYPELHQPASGSGTGANSGGSNVGG